MPASAEENERLLIAFVLLDEPSFPDEEALLAALWRRWGRLHIDWEGAAETDDRGLVVRTLRLGDDAASVVLMPVPVPWRDLEGPCATARFWPEATEVCRAHRAHLVVALRSQHKDRLDQHLTLTHLVSALVQASGTSAVYWANGTVVHSGAQFMRFAEDADRTGFPVNLWVDFRVFPRDDGSLYVATTGLSTFGLMEIEGASRRVAPRELFEKVFDLSHYLICSGPVIRDGDTVGGDERERIVARYARSVWPRDGQVLFLEFDGPQPRRGLLDFFKRNR